MVGWRSASAGPLPRHRRIPLTVLVLVLLLSVTAALLLNRFVMAQQDARFEREVNAYTSSLQDRLVDYENLLRAARSFWLVENGPDQAAFGAFVNQLDLNRRYPGVLAVGFVRWQPGPHAPITRIAPVDGVNLAALGFDMMTDASRRAAILRARAQGTVQVSQPVKLVQRGEDGERLDGLLVFLPVKRGDELQGLVYLALQTDQFLRGLARPDAQPGVAVRTLLNGQPLGASGSGGDVTFRRSTRVDEAGAAWTLEFSAPGSFGQDVVASVPTVVLVAGLLVAGLAFLLSQSQVRARERAEEATATLAQSRARLEQSRAEFEAIFQAIQDSAAFTDADGQVRLVNRALTGQFGYAPGALIGTSLGQLHLDRRLEDRSTFQALTTPYRRRDGSVFSGEAQRSEVVAPGGEVLGLLEVVRDVTERVQAERAVQAEERRSRAVLDAIPHILWVSDPGGEITYVNAQHRERLGEDRVRERVYPEDRPFYDRMWEDAYATHARAQCEVRLRLGGHRGDRWFVLRVAPLHAQSGEAGGEAQDQGRVTEWVASATDIHDRLVAERLAQRNEERYRGVLEGMPQIVWLTDAEGRPTYFNRRWDEYVGPERASAGFLSLVHPEDRPDYQTRWAAAVRGQRSFEAEHRLLGADGRYRTFVTRGLPVRDMRGQVLEWVGTSTDVDDQVYAEAAARLLADVSEQLSARATDPLASRSETYRVALDRITQRLAGSAGLWGAPPELDLLATSHLDPRQVSPAAREEARQALRRVTASEEPLFAQAERYPLLHEVNATGAVLYPLVGRDGTLRGVLGLSYRQTPRDRDHELAYELAKRFATALDNDALRLRADAAQADLQALNTSLEERVEQRTLELQEANRELEAFSYSVSHDLRTPLRHIVGFGDLLRKDAAGGLSPKSERYLGVITDAAGRMSQLIDDLLEFSRMGRQELRRTSVDLGGAVQEVWRDLEPDRAGRDVTLEAGPLPTVQGDAALLTQVLSNLLANAIKYTRTREHAHIRVTAREDAGEVTLTVRDNGVGFDPRYTDKLFGVFQRLHRAEEFEGTGIGLANVRRIVNRHGGRVSAESVPGEGAAFHVTLPLELEPQDGGAA